MAKQKRTTQLKAWLLLIVFAMMQTLIPLHQIEESWEEHETALCHDCQHHVHHSHIGEQAHVCHDCVICQGASLPFLAAHVTALDLPTDSGQESLCQAITPSLISTLRGIVSPRAPPTVS